MSSFCFDGGYTFPDTRFVWLISFCLAAFVGCLIRSKDRRQVPWFWLVLSLPFFGTFLIFLQHYLHGEGWMTFWRYHYPMYVLLIPFLAKTLAVISRRSRPLMIGVSCVLGLWFCRNAAHVIRHRFARTRPAERIAAQLWCADLIRRDYRGPACTTLEYDMNEYRTSRLPLVFSPEPLPAYLAGGRTEGFGSRSQNMPQYWFYNADSRQKDIKGCSYSWDEIIAEWYPGVIREKIGEFSLGFKRYVLYRTKQ